MSKIGSTTHVTPALPGTFVIEYDDATGLVAKTPVVAWLTVVAHHQFKGDVDEYLSYVVPLAQGYEGHCENMILHPDGSCHNAVHSYVTYDDWLRYRRNNPET